MTAFSCHVRVQRTEPRDMGAVAFLAWVPGGGIDIVPADFTVQLTEDAAATLTPGAELKLALSDDLEAGQPKEGSH